MGVDDTATFTDGGKSKHVIERIENELQTLGLRFDQTPVVIGGTALEYYGVRKSGADIDLVVCDMDYQRLAKQYPDKRKDIWGDLGIVLGSLEIWRSILLFDYTFYIQGAVSCNYLMITSLEKLLFMRVCTLNITNQKTAEKYKNDLKLIEKYYYDNLRNDTFIKEAKPHLSSYEKNNGTVWGGKY